MPLRWGGLHRPSLTIIGVQLLAALITIPRWPRIGFHAFGGLPIWWLLTLAFLVPWLYLAASPTSDPRVRSVFLALTLIFTGSLIAGPAQYVVVGVGRPVVDVLALDRALGFDVPRLSHWWLAHYPWTADWLGWAYGTNTGQLLALPVVLGLFLQDADALWELVWHATVCSFLCILAFGLWPAGAPAAYYNHANIATWLELLRSGHPVPGGLNYDTLQGLISFPSLHTCWAWMFLWVVRRHGWLVAALLPINLLMAAATLLLGLHFGVDLIGTAVVCVVSGASYRLVARRV